jgi:Ca2+-binding EF-hand superfamily protein
MLGYQSEQQLQQLISDLARLENNCERTRQDLAALYDFNPKNAFQRIDRYRNYSLDVFEIKDFLRDQGKFVSNSEVDLLIRSHSSGSKLGSREFEAMVLPQTDRNMADHTFSRRETYVGRNDFLSRDVESVLSDLLYNEIQGLRRLEDDKARLRRRYDFSSYASFDTVDKFRSGSITQGDMIDFVKRAGGWATYQDADSIYRRLDSNKNGRLSYSEISNFLNGTPAQSDSNLQSSQAQPSRNSHSPLRQSQY